MEGRISDISRMEEILERNKDNRKIAIYDGDRTVSYQDLLGKAEKAADFFDNQGLVKNRAVLFYLSKSIEYVIHYFAISKLNGIVVPIDLDCRQEQFCSTLTYCDISLIITEKGRMAQVESILVNSGISVTVYCADTEQITMRSANMSYPEVKNTGSEEDVILFLHTSGTTSKPKRVMLSHRNILQNIRASIEQLDMGPEERTLITLPFHFCYSNIAQLLTHLYLGGSVVLYKEGYNPYLVLQYIENYRCTNTNFVPSTIELLAKIRFDRYDISSLHYLFMGGGFLAGPKLKAVLEKFKNVEFIHTYGQTEASPRITQLLPDKALEKVGSVGRPLPGIQVRIVDETGEEAEVNKIGEIITKSDCIMKGYYKNQKETERVIRNGWLYTGDLGILDKDGYLFIVGRKKNIIISGGINIYPEEIEEVLCTYPIIKEAIVFGISHNVMGELPAAKVVIEDDCDLNRAELIHFLRERLEDYKMPIEIAVVEQIIKTGSGKIMRREL